MTAQEPVYTQADIDSLGEKLTQFAGTLTPGEEAALTVALRCAIATADTSGYMKIPLLYAPTPPSSPGDKIDPDALPTMIVQLKELLGQVRTASPFSG